MTRVVADSGQCPAWPFCAHSRVAVLRYGMSIKTQRIYLEDPEPYGRRSVSVRAAEESCALKSCTGGMLGGGAEAY